MTRGDQVVERAAGKLDELAQQAAREDGLKAKLAEPLAEDAALLRGMRPSRITARLRGEQAHETAAAEPLPPPEPRPKAKSRPRRSRRGGPNPIVVAVGAFVVGLVLAKVVDWRGHAHPR
jgi:hypothetical protein